MAIRILLILFSLSISMITNTEEPTTLTPVEMTYMIEEINQLSNAEHEQIFQIIHEQSCRYTENLNGVFLNLTNLPMDTLYKIQQILIFWKDQKEHINDSEKERQNIENQPNEPELETEAISHRAHQAQNAPSTTQQTIFQENKNMTKILTKKENSLICGNAEKKTKLVLNNQAKQQLIKKGGSALRVAKKCMATTSEE